jgi:LacI family transcriptional regulator
VVTGHDVARLAGVSQPTVSRALRNNPHVSPATIERVRAAALKLNYVPTQSGRALVTRRTNRIAVVAADINNAFYPALVGPIHDVLCSVGYRTVLVSDTAAAPVEITELLDGSIDGAILTTCRADSTLPASLARHGIPVVLLNREVRGAPTDCCAFDNAAGGAAVARLLVELGHRRIATLCGPRDTSTGRDRESGFRTELRQHGVSLDRAFVLHAEFSYDDGHAGFRALMSKQQPPTAVFCANDTIALGALNAARLLGVRIPHDVSIVGFDDIPIAHWEAFSLTTVRGDLQRMAVTGARLMLDRIRHPGGSLKRIRISPEVVLRQTHGPPARDTGLNTVSGRSCQPAT